MGSKALTAAGLSGDVWFCSGPRTRKGDFLSELMLVRLSSGFSVKVLLTVHIFVFERT